MRRRKRLFSTSWGRGSEDEPKAEQAPLAGSAPTANAPLKNFAVLLVEDDLVVSVTLGRALRAGLADALVLTAHSLAEARLILKEDKIHFFILDINLPDGSGIDFILDITTHNPEAKIMLMTGAPLPEYRNQAQAFGVLHYMEKPLDHQTLLRLIRESRSSQAPLGGEESSLFSVALSRLTVLDILQLKCLNNSSQVLNFKSRTQGSGRVHFQNGEIVHAETERFKGLEALTEIIRWKGGYAEEVAQQSDVKRTITGNWQGVLLAAAQSADEQASG